MNKEQYEKELALKDEEYNILKITSQQIEEEQQREIYELRQKIDKSIKLIEETNLGFPYSDFIEKEKLLNILND